VVYGGLWWFMVDLLLRFMVVYTGLLWFMIVYYVFVDVYGGLWRFYGC